MKKQQISNLSQNFEIVKLVKLLLKIRETAKLNFQQKTKTLQKFEKNFTYKRFSRKLQQNKSLKNH